MLRHRAFKVIFVILGLIAALGAGILLSLYLIPTPEIAVIRLDTDIWDFYTDPISQALDEADADPAVRAVVLSISSPGGEVTASEDLYFDLLRLRESMPVVASIDQLAASGAYFVASAADVIYAKAASEVGNVGVIGILRSPDLLDEELITTGPFKLSGGPQVAQTRQIEMLKETLLAAILAQRADRLTVAPEVLSRGELYLGPQARQLGLIDEIGSQADAIAAAARMAGARHYVVSDRTPEEPDEFTFFGYQARRGTTAATLADLPRDLPPGFYYRYLEPSH